MCGFGCTGSSGLVLYTDDFCHFYNYWPLYGKRCSFLSGLRSSGWKETERRYLALLLAVISIFILAFAGNLMQFFVGADYRGRREILKNWGSHLCGDWDAVSLVWLFPGHKQTPYLTDSYRYFPWHPGGIILCSGTAYCIWGSCNMVFDTDWVVSGRYCGVRFLL